LPKPISQRVTPTLPQEFQFVQSRELEKHFQFGKHQRVALARRLPQGIYWIQPDRAFLWNITLVTDYLLNGDGPAHQRLTEQYLATLPQSN
jgi:hypothetical protein